MNEKKNEIMTKVEAPLGDTTITLFRRPGDTNEGDLYFTAKEGASALGLCSYRTFLELARDHRDEMIVGEEIVLPSRTIGGKGRDTKLFRISVLDLLGPLTKSEAGKKIRRWTADIRQRFRRGESAEITREQFDALRAQVASLAAERDAARLEAGNLRADLRLSIGSGRETAKLAATIFNECKKQRRRERSAEMFSDASLFAKSEEKLIALDEKILAALVRHGPFDTVGDLAKFVRVALDKIGDSVSTLAARGLICRIDGKVALKPNTPTTGEVSS